MATAKTSTEIQGTKTSAATRKAATAGAKKAAAAKPAAKGSTPAKKTPAKKVAAPAKKTPAKKTPAVKKPVTKPAAAKAASAGAKKPAGKAPGAVAPKGKQARQIDLEEGIAAAKADSGNKQAAASNMGRPVQIVNKKRQTVDLTHDIIGTCKRNNIALSPTIRAAVAEYFAKHGIK